MAGMCLSCLDVLEGMFGSVSECELSFFDCCRLCLH